MNKIRNTTPIFLPLLGLIAGIYIQSIIMINPHILAFSLCFLCTILLILIIKNNYLTLLKIITFITFFVVGALCIYLQKSRYQAELKTLCNKNITVIATVVDKKTLPKKNKFDMAENFCINIDKTIESPDLKTNFSLSCYSRFNTNIQVGDVIQLDNIKIKTAENDGLSGNTSYQDFLCKEGFLTSIFLNKNHNLKIIERPKYSIQRWIWKIKSKIYNDLRLKMDEQTFKYFALIFLGNTQQTEILQMRETFNYWGLSHYLARSGLHIVFFILIWTFLFRFIPIGLNWKRILLILLCIIYKLLSWSSIPFIRAFYVFLLMEGGKLFDFQTNFLHLLSIVCLSVLLFNPMQLFFLDFQLSFGLTFALSWAMRYF